MSVLPKAERIAKAAEHLRQELNEKGIAITEVIQARLQELGNPQISVLVQKKEEA